MNAEQVKRLEDRVAKIEGILDFFGVTKPAEAKADPLIVVNYSPETVEKLRQAASDADVVEWEGKRYQIGPYLQDGDQLSEQELIWDFCLGRVALCVTPRWFGKNDQYRRLIPLDAKPDAQSATEPDATEGLPPLPKSSSASEPGNQFLAAHLKWWTTPDLRDYARLAVSQATAKLRERAEAAERKLADLQAAPTPEEVECGNAATALAQSVRDTRSKDSHLQKHVKTVLDFFNRRHFSGLSASPGARLLEDARRCADLISAIAKRAGARLIVRNDWKISRQTIDAANRILAYEPAPAPALPEKATEAMALAAMRARFNAPNAKFGDTDEMNCYLAVSQAVLDAARKEATDAK